MSGVPTDSHGGAFNGGTITAPLAVVDPNAAHIPLEVDAAAGTIVSQQSQVYVQDENGGQMFAVGGDGSVDLGLNTGAAFRVRPLNGGVLGGVIYGGNRNGEPTTRGNVTGALATTTFVSGTGKKIDAAVDRELIVPVTFNPTAGAAATCLVQLSPDNVTYTTLGTETEPAGVAFDGTIHLLRLLVPANWFIKLTVTNATIGTGTYY